MKVFFKLFIIAILFSYNPFLYAASDKDALLKEYAGSWLESDEIISAIEASNKKHEGISQADIDKMDKEWRAEAEKGGGELTASLLNSDISKVLVKKKEGFGGKVTEIFIMDNKGLNVAQSDMTSDYWQGDEPKFQQSFGAGENGVHLSDVEFDESTQTYQVQLSRSIVDKSGKKIGAVTLGIIVEK